MIRNWLIIFLFWLGPATAQHSKIAFTYEQKSNYRLSDDGVRADTLLFKVDFPALNFEKQNVNGTTIGFVRWKDISPEQMKRLASAIYHEHQIWEGEHDIEKNITRIKVVRDDPNVRAQFRKYFDKGYSAFKYRIVINYKRRMIHNKFPTIQRKSGFDKNTRTVIFFDDTQIQGKYSKHVGNRKYENIVDFDSALDRKIVPAELFSNSNFGVRRIQSVHETITLTSYHYK